MHNCKKSEQRAEGQEMRSDPDRTDPAELAFCRMGHGAGLHDYRMGP